MRRREGRQFPQRGRMIPLSSVNHSSLQKQFHSTTFTPRMPSVSFDSQSPSSEHTPELLLKTDRWREMKEESELSRLVGECGSQTIHCRGFHGQFAWQSSHHNRQELTSPKAIVHVHTAAVVLARGGEWGEWGGDESSQHETSSSSSACCHGSGHLLFPLAAKVASAQSSQRL
jgi:hypothetical protein